MKSFTFFRTEEGNYYLYNSRKSSLLNVHPVIKVIEALDNNDGVLKWVMKCIKI